MILALTGYAQSGKDTAAQVLVSDYGFVKLAFADPVRDLAKALDPYVRVDGNRYYTEGDAPFARYSTVLDTVGYERAKGFDDVRRLLQRIGTEAGRSVFGDNVWVDVLARRLFAKLDEQPEPNIVITDVRFPNEAEFVKYVGGYVVRMSRVGQQNASQHASEQGVDAIEPDLCITAADVEEVQDEIQRVYDVCSLREKARQARSTSVVQTPLSPLKQRIYLAAPWANKAEACDAKQRLIAAGLDVVSGWTERENTPAEIAPERMTEQAVLDANEVALCDVLVILDLGMSQGKACEFGMALAQGKRLVLVKPDRKSNIFYNMPQVERVDTLDEAIALLTPPLGVDVCGSRPGSNEVLINVRRDGDDVVGAKSGVVIATKLGTLDSEKGYTAVIHSVTELEIDPEARRKLGVITDVASAAAPEPFDLGLVEQVTPDAEPVDED